jgi:hypothetical protein
MVTSDLVGGCVATNQPAPITKLARGDGQDLNACELAPPHAREVEAGKVPCGCYSNSCHSTIFDSLVRELDF